MELGNESLVDVIVLIEGLPGPRPNKPPDAVNKERNQTVFTIAIHSSI